MRATLLLRANMATMFKGESWTERRGRCVEKNNVASQRPALPGGEAVPNLRQVSGIEDGSETSPGGGQRVSGGGRRKTDVLDVGVWDPV